MNNPQESENLVDELHNQPYEPMVAAEIWLVSLSLFIGISILIILALVIKINPQKQTALILGILLKR